MDTKFLIDTNVLIYYLDGKIPSNHFERVSQIFENSFNISTITKIEVLDWHKITAPERNKIEKFIDSANIFYFDKVIEKRTIEIKQSCKVALPDALIAATALIHDLTLVTRNESDFKNIKDLIIYNPFS
jgi:predicted nucleic acid-binding protein